MVTGKVAPVNCNEKDYGLEITVHNHGQIWSSKGWGIWLAFIKKVAEAHGGTIRGDQQVRGAIFQLFIPRA
ncbi:MAG TPA: hypothetical protein VKA10_12425 [Prolixibacteraceae bacterium]|nr:hypothetical protein [Prolixibacteraceae bacterium]